MNTNRGTGFCEEKHPLHISTFMLYISNGDLLQTPGNQQQHLHEWGKYYFFKGCHNIPQLEGGEGDILITTFIKRVKHATNDSRLCCLYKYTRFEIYIYNILCILFCDNTHIFFFFPGWSQELLIEVKLFFTYHQSIRYSIISIYCAPFCADIIISIPSKFIIIYTLTIILSV